MKRQQTKKNYRNVGRILPSFCVTIAFLIVCFDYEPLFANQPDINPELLQRFTIVEENDQIVVEVRLRDLLLLALERATTIDILEIDNQIANDAYAASREIYNPTLTTSLAHQRALSTSGTNVSGNVISSTTGTTASFLSLSTTNTTAISTTWAKKTKSGIVYSLAYQTANSQTYLGSYEEEGDAFSGWDVYDDPLYTDSLTASVSVPIFQDWGDINKIYEYKGNLGVEQTTFQSQKTKLELLQLVAGIYWDLVGVEQNIVSLRASEKLSEQFVSDSKTRMQLGVLDPIEVKQSESQLLLVQRNLLSETFQKKLIEDQIKVALNLEEIPYGYKPTEEIRQRDERFDFGPLLKVIYANSQDLNLLHTQLKMNALQIKEAENDTKTDLDFSLEYQLNGFGSGNSQSVSGMSETNLSDYQLGLTWNLPLFDKQSPQVLQQRRLEQSKINLQISDVKAQLKISLQSVLRNLKLAEEGIKLANTSVKLAEDLLEKETEKFKLGNNTSFRVAQVQQDLTDAKKNMTLSQVQYEKTYLNLLILTGRIFSEYDLPQ